MSQHRDSLISITLTELALILFFILLLLTTQTSRGERRHANQVQATSDSIQAEVSQLRDLQQFRDALPPEVIEDEDFLELLRNLWHEADSLRSVLTDAQKKNVELERRFFAEESVSGEDGPKGFGPPPCWQDPAGKIEYIYNIEMTDSSVSVGRGDRDPGLIPGGEQFLGQYRSLDEFRKQARPIYVWCMEQGCRHYVRLSDHTTSKREFKSKLLTVEAYFYKLLVDEEP